MAYGKFVSSADDMPDGLHWAIITGERVTIPGDERSRTHPGHGYPEHTKSYITYEAFSDKAEFEREYQRRTEEAAKRDGFYRDNFICIEVSATLRPLVKAVTNWSQ